MKLSEDPSWECPKNPSPARDSGWHYCAEDSNLTVRLYLFKQLSPSVGRKEDPPIREFPRFINQTLTGPVAQTKGGLKIIRYRKTRSLPFALCSFTVWSGGPGLIIAISGNKNIKRYQNTINICTPFCSRVASKEQAIGSYGSVLRPPSSPGVCHKGSVRNPSRYRLHVAGQAKGNYSNRRVYFRRLFSPSGSTWRGSPAQSNQQHQPASQLGSQR